MSPHEPRFPYERREDMSDGFTIRPQCRRTENVTSDTRCEADYISWTETFSESRPGPGPVEAERGDTE